MHKLHSSIPTFFLFFCLFMLGCSSSGDLGPCESDAGVSLANGSCLLFEDQGALDNERTAITSTVSETITKVNNVMSVDNLTIKILADASQVIPEIGIGGFNPSEREVIIRIDPNFNDLSQSIATELAPMLAHEMHHAKRRRTVGYGSSLFEASVTEGLADCFAMEITGIDPPLWSVALTGGDLDNWITNVSSTWTNNSYDHSKWFLGTSAEVPRWTGYAIGFKLVKDYLLENPTRMASDLFDEPAGSFAQ